MFLRNFARLDSNWSGRAPSSHLNSWDYQDDEDDEIDSEGRDSEDSEEGTEDRVIGQHILNDTHCANENLLKEGSKESRKNWRRGGWWHAGAASSSTVVLKCISQLYFPTVISRAFLNHISRMLFLTEFINRL